MKESITLYHFCDPSAVDGIKEKGLVYGLTPVIREYRTRFMKNTQWLTDDPNPTTQSWNTQILLYMSRTSFRLTVVIPAKHKRKLLRAVDFIEELPKESRPFVTAYPGHEHWYVYRGVVLPQWIKKVDDMRENECKAPEEG